MAERKGVAHWLWTAKTCCAELPASFYGRMARRMMPVHGRHPPCNPSGRGLYPLCGPGYQDVGAGNVDERKRRLVMRMRIVRPARGASMARHGCAAPERAVRGHAAHEDMGGPRCVQATEKVWPCRCGQARMLSPTSFGRQHAEAGFRWREEFQLRQTRSIADGWRYARYRFAAVGGGAEACTSAACTTVSNCAGSLLPALVPHTTW